MSAKEGQPSSKVEKPTLAGVTLKTRKRNIVIPVDPGSFANAVVHIVQDAGEGLPTLEEQLEAGTKALDNANLEFSRYSDTLFECFFAGGMLAAGGKLADENAPKLETNILASEATREAISPYIKVFATLLRRRPFLIKGLENTLIKLLLTTEFFDEANRKKLGIALALVFNQKITVVGENIFQNGCFNDRLITKGTMLEVLTVFFQEFLAKDSLDDLVTILTKGKVVNRMLDFFPPQNRTVEDFNKHFTNSGLIPLVEWYSQQALGLKIDELQETLTDAITQDPPMSPSEILALIKAKKEESNLPEGEVLRVVWTALMASMNMTGKNQQQIFQGLVQKIKTYHKLLSSFATNGKQELALLLIVQVYCYEDNRLLKIFSDILRLLYDADIVGEDTIMHWYRKGSHPKGRNVFLKDVEPFIQWLEEAEEDSDGEGN